MGSAKASRDKQGLKITWISSRLKSRSSSTVIWLTSPVLLAMVRFADAEILLLMTLDSVSCATPVVAVPVPPAVVVPCDRI